VTAKYLHLNINALFEMYLDAEGLEKAEIEREVYRRCRNSCLRRYRWLFSDVLAEDAEEFFHDAMLDVFRRGTTGKNIQGLLKKAFISKVYDHFRLKKVQTEKRIMVRLTLHDPDEERFWDKVGQPVGPDVRVPDSRERRAHIWDCLERLPERQKRCIELRLEGWKNKRIGNAVSGSIKDLVFHARSKLARCLQERHQWDYRDLLPYLGKA